MRIYKSESSVSHTRFRSKVSTYLNLLSGCIIVVTERTEVLQLLDFHMKTSAFRGQYLKKITCCR